MSTIKGKIVLMGSGEMTASMVEVHKGLLADLPGPSKAVFLDTPAGFQMNVNQIYQKAFEYFRDHVQHSLSLSSFKSKDDTTGFDAEEAFHILKEASYIFIGPGSPTYALRHWKETPIPDILYRCVRKGGCLVAASAAALTLGRFTLPVYEIYKVGQDPQWAEGLDILGRFDFNLVVIPHWNNTEGGNHDTRFCYMGESRFLSLEALLPERIPILGLEEHTACILNFESGEGEIRGVGSIVLRTAEEEITFKTGERFSLNILPKKEIKAGSEVSAAEVLATKREPADKQEVFASKMRSLEERFRSRLEGHDFKEATRVLLELDRLIWQNLADRENDSAVALSRDTIRDLIFSLGTELDSSPQDRAECLEPLVEALLKLRQNFRDKKQWDEADMIRDILLQADITVKDTEKGYQWQIESREENK